MNGYFMLVTLISLAAFFAYINHQFFKLPFVIGIFLLSIVLSFFVLTAKLWGVEYYAAIKENVDRIEYSKIILDILLGFLLFAGSLHTRWSGIKRYIKPVSLLAVGGVIFSTLVVAGLLHTLCLVLNVELSMLYCLIFGAIISPTDPIAVLGILTKANVSKKVEATIVGESLFNDGIGVVLFIAFVETLTSEHGQINITRIGWLVAQGAFGGILFGLLLGYILHRVLKSIDHYETEVLITIAFVMLGYSLCSYLHVSGALAMVIMGLFVGNYQQKQAMSDVTLEYVLKFWEMLDVILNALLFIGIGFVLILIDFKPRFIIIGALSVVIVLIARTTFVYLAKAGLKKTFPMTGPEARLIVWGGLRGGLSIALVLSLPDNETKQLLLIATYMCVVFSILIQGLTISSLARNVKE